MREGDTRRELERAGKIASERTRADTRERFYSGSKDSGELCTCSSYNSIKWPMT